MRERENFAILRKVILPELQCIYKAYEEDQIQKPETIQNKQIIRNVMAERKREREREKID
jgi:hypothetical protein